MRYFIVFYIGTKPGKTKSYGFDHVTSSGGYIELNSYCEECKKKHGFEQATVTGFNEVSEKEFYLSIK